MILAAIVAVDGKSRKARSPTTWRGPAAPRVEFALHRGDDLHPVADGEIRGSSTPRSRRRVQQIGLVENYHVRAVELFLETSESGFS